MRSEGLGGCTIVGGLPAAIVKTNTGETRVPESNNNIDKTLETDTKVMDKAAEFLEHVLKSKSKNTYWLYKQGLTKFIEWYGKDSNTILEERKAQVQSGERQQINYFANRIEEFFKNLKTQLFSRNSARANTNGITAFFRYYGFPVEYESTDITKVVMTTKDFVPTIEQYRAMFQFGDLRARVILSLGLDLAWRIGDFIKVTKAMLPDLDQEYPIEFDLITEKEDVLAKSFLSAETIELLKAYIPTLKPENPYLFQSNSHNHLEEQSMNDIIKNLSKKCKIKIPEGKRLRFHCFRKRFLSTCANLKIDVNIAKILCGKSVSADMMAYLSEVDLRKAFLEVKQVLTLEATMRKTATSTQLEKELEDMKRLVHGLIAIVGKDKAEEIRKLAHIETIPYSTEEVESEEQIKRIGDKRLETKEKLSKEQLEEYRKLIEENNNH